MVHKAATRRFNAQIRFRGRSEAKKEDIRRAALRLFQLHGFKKVTIREIAREADVSQVTIYNQFGSKEGLIRDVVSNLVEEVVDEFRSLMAEKRTFPEKLDWILLGKMKAVSQYGGELMETLVAKDPELRDLVRRTYDREIMPMVASFFDEGREQGYVNPELSQEAILAYTEIFRNGLMARPELLAESEKPAGLVRELMTLYLYGLMGRPSPEAQSDNTRGK